jgi:hypothetical protein
MNGGFSMKKFTVILAALLCSAALAQNPNPSVAVYVTGDDVSGRTKDALAAYMLDALVNSGRYRAIERSEAFLLAIEEEHVKQRGGAVDDAQIREIGKQAGVQFVCVAAITPAMGEHQISARIIDVETADIIASGVSGGPLGSLDDLKRVAAAAVYNMIGVRVRAEKDFELLTEREEAVLERRVDKSVEEAVRESKRKKPSFWIGLGVGGAGAGILGYAVYENINVGNHNKKGELAKREEAKKRRNNAAIVGAAVLAAGVSIQIIF